jgi:hypothetical protein
MPGEGLYRRGKYRWRTWLRTHEPNWLYQVWSIPKGRTDCGNHEFYHANNGIDRCYHCERGTQPHDPDELAQEAAR